MPDWLSTSSSAGFDCTVNRGTIRCSDSESGHQLIISAEDILCILPADGKQTQNSLLFLRKAHGKSELDTTQQIERIPLKSVPKTLPPELLLADIPKHLSAKLHIIVSTASGTGAAKSLFDQLKQLLAHIGLLNYEVHETQSTQTVNELSHLLFIPQAEAGIHQTIILLSGDGGLCDIINAFYNTSRNIRTKPNIALIPAGTGNAMASSTGLLANHNAALTTLLRGRSLPVPAFAATFSPGAVDTQGDEGRYFVTSENGRLKVYGGVVASWGLHAALVADSDTVEYRKFGADRFKMVAQELLFPSNGSATHRYNGVITMTKVDDQGDVEPGRILESNEHMYVLATLVSNLEKDFRISPKSIPMDGSMRLVRFGSMPSERAVQLLSAAYQNGQHVWEDEVLYAEIEAFRIDFLEVDEKWRRVCIDGRVVVVGEGGWMEVRKEKMSLLNILLPEV
ncbi:ATP-NAD kinase-like domain-containing protein [Aspergillus crustosus]